MDLRALTEFGFIDAVGEMAGCTAPDLLHGIGDDAAVLACGDQRLVVTVDAMLEGQHFRLDWLTPEEAGTRAMTAGLSDVAAMGAVPRFAFTSVGIPRGWSAEQALSFSRGLIDQARRHGACVAGGDTVATSGPALVDVAVIGVCGEHIWLRDGARVGDVLCVTGCLGGSAASVAALAAGIDPAPCRQRYARPEPRVAVAARLNPLGLIHAAMDVSDGLVQDAGHICRRSGVGAVIHAAQVPVDPGAQRVAEQLGADPLEYALAGGEDFELLFATDPADVPDLTATAGIAISVVGVITDGGGVAVRDATGNEISLSRRGWDHFR